MKTLVNGNGMTRNQFCWAVWLLFASLTEIALPQTTGGTVIIFIRMPDEILIAADSKVANYDGMLQPGSNECKISQFGDIFFCLSGLSGHTTLPYNIVGIAKRTLDDGQYGKDIGLSNLEKSLKRETESFINTLHSFSPPQFSSLLEKMAREDSVISNTGIFWFNKTEGPRIVTFLMRMATSYPATVVISRDSLYPSNYEGLTMITGWGPPGMDITPLQTAPRSQYESIIADIILSQAIARPHSVGLPTVILSIRADGAIWKRRTLLSECPEIKPYSK